MGPQIRERGECRIAAEKNAPVRSLEEISIVTAISAAPFARSPIPDPDGRDLVCAGLLRVLLLLVPFLLALFPSPLAALHFVFPLIRFLLCCSFYPSLLAQF